MADHSTQVSTEFHGPDVTGGEEAEISLVLEQKEIDPESGNILTMQEIADANGLEFVEVISDAAGRQVALGTDIEQISELYYAQCGKNPDGSITITIYVFKTPSNLTYRLIATYGEFEENCVTESIVKEESVDFRMSQSEDLGYHVENIESIEWDGDVFNASGGVINPAVPTLSGTKLILNEPVYGSVRVKYKVFGDTWTLNIFPREGATDNIYQSTVMAFYGDNQVETLDVTPPNLTDLCSESASVALCGYDCEEPADDDDGDGTSVALQLNAYDYCTGSAISGATFWIGGVQVPATGHTVKRGTTYSITVKASGYKDSNTDDLSDNDSFSV